MSSRKFQVPPESHHMLTRSSGQCKNARSVTNATRRMYVLLVGPLDYWYYGTTLRLECGIILQYVQYPMHHTSREEMAATQSHKQAKAVLLEAMALVEYRKRVSPATILLQYCIVIMYVLELFCHCSLLL